VTNYQDTTVPRVWSSWLDRQKIEYDLDESGIAYEDFYPTCTPGVWLIEAVGNAKRLAYLLDRSDRFESIKPIQNWSENTPCAMVLFRHFEPEDPEVAARWDSADNAYDERRLSR